MKTATLYLIAFLFFAFGTKTYSQNCTPFPRVDSLDVSELPKVEYVYRNVRFQWGEKKNSFFCKYFIIEWGCGTGCQMYAVFNQQSGKLIDMFNTSMGCSFDDSSNLIKVHEDSYWGTKEYFYKVENDTLIRLGSP